MNVSLNKMLDWNIIMIIKDGKIIECTDIELFEYWLKRYDDVYSYPDFKQKMVELGVLINE